MKKSLKMLFSVVICAVLSVLILPCVSARLDKNQMTELDQLCSQFVDAYASGNLSEWRKSVIRKIKEIAVNNPHNHVIAGEALVYMVSKITESPALRDIEIRGFSISKPHIVGNQIQFLRCSITTLDHRMILLEI